MNTMINGNSESNEVLETKATYEELETQIVELKNKLHRAEVVSSGRREQLNAYELRNEKAKSEIIDLVMNGDLDAKDAETILNALEIECTQEVNVEFTVKVNATVTVSIFEDADDLENEVDLRGEFELVHNDKYSDAEWEITETSVVD